MKKVVASLVAVAGLSVAAKAVVNTNLVWQLSSDGGTNWAQYNAGSPLQVAPGASVQARAVVSYIQGSNTATPIGLASLFFQPVVTNWTAADTLAGFVNGGIGSNTSTPPGVVTNNTDFGRLSPFGRTALASSNALFGHVQDNGSGTTVLRIAQRQATSFIGGTGNSSGGSGVPIAQLSDVGRTTADPAFNPNLTNVVIFRYGITLSSAATRPDLSFDSPIAGFGNLNTTNGDREVYYFGASTESTGQLRGTANVTASFLRVIPVPAPASAALLGLGGLVAARRRRQA